MAINLYPDVWYQGASAFSDAIWRINVDTEEIRLFSNLTSESNSVIDVTNLKINSTDDYLIFNDKFDLSLWGLRLKDTLEANVGDRSCDGCM